MDAFAIIQNFFTKMRCQQCNLNFETEDIQLESEAEGYYVVSLECHHCGCHNGTAAVGVEAGACLEDLMALESSDIADIFAAATQQRVETPKRKRFKRFKDPEFTEADRRRLALLEPIDEEDVLNAHQFFEDLDSDWQKHIPQSLRSQSITLPE